MLTKKDLLLNDVKIPDQEDNAEMALPPELKNSTEKAAKRHKKLFSGAIFRESLHSNKLSLIICALGNALIMVVIICIMSTLHINATSDAMRSMFNNADLESTAKMGAVSLYSVYSNSAEAYTQFNSGQETLETTTYQALEMVNDSDLNSQISTAKAAYDVAYTLASGSESQKNISAKSTTMALVQSVLSSSDSLTEDEKKAAYYVLNYYFDIYAEDKNAATSDILTKAIPHAMSDILSEQMELNAESKEAIYEQFNDAFTRVYTDGESSQNVAFETSIELLALVTDDEQKEMIQPITEALLDSYREEPDAFFSKKNTIVSEYIQDYVISAMEEIAYYQYLPSFAVNVLTSERGYPIYYVGTGEYAQNGNEIMEEKEIFTYNPDLYIEVTADMGPTSNMAEKMHKEIITGQGYTDEEIAQAKKDAQEDMGMIKDNLASFMAEFIVRDADNKNKYFDGTRVDDLAIQEAVQEYMMVMAEDMVIEEYNKENDVKISSLDELTAENYIMSGQEIRDTLNSYVVSGIASFKSYLASAQEKEDYSELDKMIVAMSKSTTGVINMLPDSVGGVLTELGDMNTYGFIIGLIAFNLANLLIPMVYTIMISSSLVASKVETGSLAFTLSTPTKRSTFIFTEAMYLIFMETAMALILFVSSVIAQSIGVAMGSQDFLTSLPIKDLALYSLSHYFLMLAISGVNFFTSCLFNKSGMSIAIGGGITIMFFIFSVLGLFGSPAMPGIIRIDSMNFFNYCTIVSLSDPVAVINQEYTTYWIKACILPVIAIVLYITGSHIFTKKDLPL